MSPTPPRSVVVRNVARRPVTAGSGRTYAHGVVGSEDPSDPVTAHLLDAGLLLAQPAPPPPARRSRATASTPPPASQES